MNQTFGRDVRLLSRPEFSEVQDHGRRVSSRCLILLGRPNTLGRDRLGIIASRKFGGAVSRNRAKRRLREIFRRQAPNRTASLGLRALDLVAIPRRDLLTVPLNDVQTEFTSALHKLRGARS